MDHETYSAELDQIFPEGETITMLAVFKNDHFNQLVRDYGLLARPRVLPFTHTYSLEFRLVRD